MDTTDEETLDRYFNWDFTDEEIGVFCVLIWSVEVGLENHQEDKLHFLSEETLDILKRMLFLMENQWVNNANP